jgi:hypothetical protein
MGVLKNVLAVLSPAIAADNNNIPGDTASVQRPRRLTRPDEGEEERAAKKQFRQGVSTALTKIGNGLRDANLVQAIVTMRIAIRAAEDCEVAYRVKLMGPCTDQEKTLFESVRIQQTERLANYGEELAALIKERDDIKSSETQTGEI